MTLHPPRKVFFSTVLLLIGSFIFVVIVVDHPYAIAQNCKYRWYATLMTSEIVPILIILGCTRFLIMCQDDTPTPDFFLFLDSIASNKLIHTFINFWGGGWLVIPTLLLKPANIVDMLLWWLLGFRIYSKLYLYLLFWAVNGF